MSMAKAGLRVLSMGLLTGLLTGLSAGLLGCGYTTGLVALDSTGTPRGEYWRDTFRQRESPA